MDTQPPAMPAPTLSPQAPVIRPSVPPRRRKWLPATGILIIMLVAVFVLTHCGSPNPGLPPESTPVASTTINTDFSNPEAVTIQGYNGPQQDAHISPDNQYLFFDSHNDAGLPQYLYVATRIDYKTFKFIGRVPGVNFEAIEGVVDSAYNFYFVSPLLLGQGGQTTIGYATFSNGSVTNVAPVNGLLPKPAPSGSRGITFDLFITPDGNTLYFSDFMVKSGGAQFSVQGAQLAIAIKNVDGTFTRLSNSADILKNVNALGSLVYNATPSADGLELAFNASSSFPIPSHIYIATRTSPSAPFGKPQLVAAAELDGQLSEPGSFSPDGKYLYFHRVLGPSTSQIYVLTWQQ